MRGMFTAQKGMQDFLVSMLRRKLKFISMTVQMKQFQSLIKATDLKNRLSISLTVL